VDPFALITRPLRALLGEAEHDVVTHSPLGETRNLEARLEEAVAAAHRAAESLERHVEVIDALAGSLPPLTESVTRLTDQLNQVLKITAPLAAAERDVSQLEGLLHRHGHHQQADDQSS
jgi:ABC-type transporter Mla subunit MlaD